MPGETGVRASASGQDGTHQCCHQHVEMQAPRECHRLREIPSLPFHKTTTPQGHFSGPSAVISHSLPSMAGQSSTLAPHVSRSAETTDDPFSHFPPSSPLLPETPRRPPPPTHVRSTPKVCPSTGSRSPPLMARTTRCRCPLISG